MLSSIVASDTGPLISLEKLENGYELMQQMYKQFIAPTVVLQELMSGTNLTPSDYFKKYQIHHFLHIVEPTKTFTYPKIYTLHTGEIQAIALALEYESPLLIEEYAGRQVAQYLGIPFSGIAGQILRAYRQKLIDISQAKAAWLRLKQNGRIGQNLYQKLLETL